MTREDARQAVFGTFDGLAVALGVIAGLLLTGKHGAVLVAAVALAGGEMVSMGAGQWLSDPQRSYRRAVVMGLATFAGGILPVVPFGFLSGWPALIAFAAITVALGAVIAELRPGARVRSHVETFAVLGLACLAAVGAAVVAGGF